MEPRQRRQPQYNKEDSFDHEYIDETTDNRAPNVDYLARNMNRRSTPQNSLPFNTTQKKL